MAQTTFSPENTAAQEFLKAQANRPGEFKNIVDTTYGKKARFAFPDSSARQHTALTEAAASRAAHQAQLGIDRGAVGSAQSALVNAVNGSGEQGRALVNNLSKAATDETLAKSALASARNEWTALKGNKSATAEALKAAETKNTEAVKALKSATDKVKVETKSVVSFAEKGDKAVFGKLTENLKNAETQIAATQTGLKEANAKIRGEITGIRKEQATVVDNLAKDGKLTQEQAKGYNDAAKNLRDRAGRTYSSKSGEGFIASTKSTITDALSPSNIKEGAGKFLSRTPEGASWASHYGKRAGAVVGGGMALDGIRRAVTTDAEGNSRVFAGVAETALGAVVAAASLASLRHGGAARV